MLDLSTSVKNIGKNAIGNEAMKFLHKFTFIMDLKLEKVGINEDGLFELS